MAIEQVIQLSAVGGDAAASEIQKTGAALNSVTENSRGMADQFSHKFEHIGLRIFAGDLIQSIGLGKEMRQVLGLLQIGMNSAAGIFGAAAGPITLIGSAILGVAAAMAAMNEKNAVSIESIKKQHDATQKALKTYDETIASLQAYGREIGGLPPKYQAWLEAEKRLREEAIERQKQSLLAEIAAIEAEIKVMEAHYSVAQTFAQGQHQMAAGMTAVIKAMFGYGPLMEALAKHLKDGAKGTQENKQQTDALKASLASLRVELDRLSKNNTQSISDELKKILDLHKSVNEEIVKNQKKALEEETKEYEKYAGYVKKASGEIGADLGNAFAKSLIEGKSFTEQMSQAFNNMAERIIADIMRMIAEWAVFTALSSFGGPAGMVGAAGLKGMGFATGGSVVVDQPTMFLAGEAGPEIAEFTPVGQAGGGSKGSGGGVGTVNIHLNVDHINGNNPAETLDMLSNEIRRETAAGRQFSATVSGVAARYPKQAY